LQQQLSKLEFVSREEFDIQARVLQRTRARLEKLEEKLSQLEQTLKP
jgi:BMFP domain-containing protein YqiC